MARRDLLTWPICVLLIVAGGVAGSSRRRSSPSAIHLCSCRCAASSPRYAGTELDAVTDSVINRTPENSCHTSLRGLGDQWRPTRDSGRRRLRGRGALGASRLRDDHVAPPCTDGRAPTRRVVAGRGVHRQPFVAEHLPLGLVPSVVATVRRGWRLGHPGPPSAATRGFWEPCRRPSGI